jgi:hypothetical protein
MSVIFNRDALHVNAASHIGFAVPPVTQMWKNVTPRREHRERSQPNYRSKMGMLEKHKDYVLRAKDYSSKKQRLQSLKRKAEERNPDEFYFKMSKTKTKVRAR